MEQGSLSAARSPRAGGASEVEWWDDDRLLAYVVLEQARMGAESLLAAGWSKDAAATDVHRAVGMAGYLASDDLDADLRHSLLELTHTHAPHAAAEDWEDVLSLALHAREILPRAIVSPARDRHLLRAHRQVAKAIDSLCALLGRPRVQEVA